MIIISVAGEFATAAGPFPFEFIRFVSSLSGRKMWTGSRAVRFLATGGNVKKLEESDFEIEWKDETGSLAEARELEGMSTQHSIALPKLSGRYTPAVPLRAYQLKALALSAAREAYAWFLDMGLGKTAIAIANAGELFALGKVRGVLILAPRGVHRQWLDEEIPKHIDPKVSVNLILWRKKDILAKEMNGKGLTFLSMNIDAIRTPRGMAVAERFLKVHSGKSMMVIDESQNIKTGSAGRTAAALKLGSMATYRRIMTGTPISKSLIDAWSQFKFLDERILGYRYMTAFRARFCIMGGWEFREIVGHRNVEEFYSLIAPHTFRLTKAEALDLPPKVYARREYEMGDETTRHYNTMKETFMAQFDSGEIVDAANAAVAMLRLQQIVCGYLPLEEAGTFEIISDERIAQALAIVEQVTGPVIIWCRFTKDIFRLIEALEKAVKPGCAVAYYGATSNKDREAAKRDYLSGAKPYFVANSAAGGTGLNLQGPKNQNAIYYSNSFNALHRWQSEDRTHRLGMGDSMSYFDIIARKSVDRPILRNLQGKKSISDMTFDEIRQAISDS